MKYRVLFLIILLLTSSIKPQLNPNATILEMWNTNHGNVFGQLRNIKQTFPTEISVKLEQQIKEYEYWYLTNQTEFIDVLYSLYDEYNARKDWTDPQFSLNEVYLKHEIFDFLSKFLPLFSALTAEEKENLLRYNVTDEFTRNIIKYGIENEFMFFNDHESDISDIIERIPELWLKKNFSYDIVNSPNLAAEDKNEYLSSFLGRSENIQSKSKRKVSDKFKTFAQEIKRNFNYNVTEFRKYDWHEQMNIVRSFTASLPDEKVKEYSSFVEEYFQEAIIDNTEFKESYTNNLFPETLEAPGATETTFNPTSNINNNYANNNNFYFKQNSPVSETIKANIIKNHLERIEKSKKDEIKWDGDCKDKENEVNEILKNKLQKFEDQEKEVEETLKSVQKEKLNNVNDSSSHMKLTLNFIVEFIKNVVKMIVMHFPFYFFKICLPPGPWTFSCCPEAAFIPQQLYNLFTIPDKVNNFKSIVGAYDTWLYSIGNDDFSEVRYAICAQSYSTVYMSAWFNKCNWPSMLLIPGLSGLIPGDLPLCFSACWQAMIMCKTSISSWGPCENWINWSTILMAIAIPSLRWRLVLMFANCTYIPFLVKWEWVPKWKPKHYNGKPGEDPGKDKKDLEETPKPKRSIKCIDCTAHEIDGETPTAGDNELTELTELTAYEKEFINLSDNSTAAWNEIERLNYVKEVQENKAKKWDLSIVMTDVLSPNEFEIEGFDYLYYYGTAKYNDQRKFKYINEERKLNNPDNIRYLIRRELKSPGQEMKINWDSEWEHIGQEHRVPGITEIYQTKANGDAEDREKSYQVMSYSSSYSDKHKKDFPFQVKTFEIHPKGRGGTR